MSGEPAKLTPARHLCASLGRMVAAISEGKRTPEQIAKELRSLADFAAGLKPSSAKPAKDTTKEEDEVFVFWRAATGKADSRFTDGRRAKVRARLRAGYTVAQIKQAIEWVCNDGFYNGENDRGKVYNDLDLICRSDDKLEAFLDRAKASGTAAPIAAVDASKQEAIEQAQEDAKIALERGDSDAYNRAQKRIRNLSRG